MKRIDWVETRGQTESVAKRVRMDENGDDDNVEASDDDDNDDDEEEDDHDNDVDDEVDDIEDDNDDIEDENDEDDNDHDDDDKDGNQDPFTLQFSDARSELILAASVAADAGEWEMDAEEQPILGRVMLTTLRNANTPRIEIPKQDDHDNDTKTPEADHTLHRLKVKKRVADLWYTVNGKLAKKTGSAVLTPLQRATFPIINTYTDMFFANPSQKYQKDIWNMVALHTLNHVYKTRDRVMKDTAKLKAEAAENKPQSELRDQGFTRPTVLVLVPFRHQAFQLVQALIPLSGTTVQANKKRFMDEFGHAPEDDAANAKKSEEYKAIFAGNIDDCFRVGIKFSRKHMKLFSGFYASDVIIASPLGLKMVIGSDGDKKRDADFLSSIEVLVLGNTDVFMMQNWDHVKSVFDVINQIPKNPHDCDFSRVRSYALDGRAKYVRQTLVFSRYFTPEINALMTHTRNISGKVKCTQVCAGAINQVVAQVPQVFHRLPSHQVTMSPDIRFTHFTETVLPSLRRSIVHQTHTLIVIPSYFDYVRVRNYLTEHDVRIGCISEYASRSESDRVRTRFRQGDVDFLVVTERCHFFRRHRIRGVRHIVFYQPTIDPGVYVELMQSLVDDDAGGAMNSANGTGRAAHSQEGSCMVIYSSFDKLALERIVGTARTNRMINGQKDTFMFTS